MYKIVGADQKEYGPISAEQIIQWIKEGRANGQTIARLEEGPWRPLAAFPEFASHLGPTAPPPAAAAVPPLASLGTTPRNNGMAIAGITCSLLGIVCCGPVFATLGLIFSCIGLAQINKKPQLYSGTGLAWAGIVIALVDYVLFAAFFTVKKEWLDKIWKNLPH